MLLLGPVNPKLPRFSSLAAAVPKAPAFARNEVLSIDSLPPRGGPIVNLAVGVVVPIPTLPLLVAILPAVVKDPPVIAPVAVIAPVTESATAGLAVPMPTLPPLGLSSRFCTPVPSLKDWMKPVPVPVLSTPMRRRSVVSSAVSSNCGVEVPVPAAEIVKRDGGLVLPMPTLPESSAVRAVPPLEPSCSAYLARRAKAEETICWRGETSLSTAAVPSSMVTPRKRVAPAKTPRSLILTVGGPLAVSL